MHVQAAEVAERRGRGEGPARPLTLRLWPYRMALIAVPVLATFLLVLGAYAGGLSIVWIGLIAIIAVPALVAALLIFDQLIPR